MRTQLPHGHRFMRPPRCCCATMLLDLCVCNDKWQVRPAAWHMSRLLHTSVVQTSLEPRRNHTCTLRNGCIELVGWLTLDERDPSPRLHPPSPCKKDTWLCYMRTVCNTYIVLDFTVLPPHSIHGRGMSTTTTRSTTEAALAFVCPLVSNF